MKDYLRQAVEIVDHMNIEDNLRDKILWNLLLTGLSSPEVYAECCKEDITKLDSNGVV